MKKLRRFLAVTMATVMLAAMVACSSGPDTTDLTNSYNSLANEYNDMIATLTELGFAEDQTFVDGMNTIADQITTVKEVIESDALDDYTQEQIDAMKDSCEALRTWVKESLETLTAPDGR